MTAVASFNKWSEISNYNLYSYVDIMINPCDNFYGGLEKPPFNLEHE